MRWLIHRRLDDICLSLHSAKLIISDNLSKMLYCYELCFFHFVDASRSCRGFGYVTFVLPEDATKALNAGINLNGRKIAVSVADKKPRQRDNYKKKNSQSPGT